MFLQVLTPDLFEAPNRARLHSDALVAAFTVRQVLRFPEFGNRDTLRRVLALGLLGIDVGHEPLAQGLQRSL
jgi:hypothetical protein